MEQCGRGLKSSFRTNSKGRLTGPGECGGSQPETRGRGRLLLGAGVERNYIG